MKEKRVFALLGAGLMGIALVSGMVKAEEPSPGNIAVGVQIWGQNCARCHNAPPPTAYGDEDWKIITHHMKLRANLTDQEIKSVLAFLQAAN